MTPSRRPFVLVGTLTYAGLLITMLFNLVIPLLPVLPGHLHASAADVTWVATGFFLTSAVAYPVLGRVADMIGNRRMLVVCAGLLVVGSVVCAVAGSLPVMLAGRVVQACSAPAMAVSLSLMRDLVPPARLPAAVGTASAAMGLGNGIGLIGGGLLIDTVGWRWVFWATALAALPLLVLAPLVIPPDGPRRRQRTDLPGSVGLVLILLGLLLPLSKLAEWRASWPTFALLGGALLLLPVWAAGRLRREDPVLDLRSMRRPPLATTHLAATTTGFAGFMAFISTTHVLQSASGFGLGVAEAGLMMTPGSMSFLVAGPVTALLIRRSGLRRAYVSAAALSAVGAGVMALGPTDSLPWLLGGFLVVLFANGMLLSSMPVGTAHFGAPGELSSTNGVNALARTTGVAFASGAFALVVDVTADGAMRPIMLLTQGLSAALCLTLVAATLLTVPRRRVATVPPSVDGTVLQAQKTE